MRDRAPAGGACLGSAGPHVPARRLLGGRRLPGLPCHGRLRRHLGGLPTPPPPPDGLPPLADGEPPGPAPLLSKTELFLRLSAGPVLLQDRLMSVWLDRETGAKCYMLSAGSYSKTLDSFALSYPYILPPSQNNCLKMELRVLQTRPHDLAMRREQGPSLAGLRFREGVRATRACAAT
ncbi:hypothetical protein ZWY2020_017751 [Hordeum vulgare]|nr:hypothetical protein ZWY2020_017751 [Hordeum vulgare]